MGDAAAAAGGSARKWQIPVGAWAGETCFILGGGASLKGFDAARLHGHRVIAIKDAGLVLCPWADVLYWADPWWLEGKDGFAGRLRRLGAHTGAWKVCRMMPRACGGHAIKVLDHDARGALSSNPGFVAGKDAGANCVNMAHLLGARTVLLGFDMAGENWDGRPRKAERNDRYRQVFIPGLERMARLIEHRGGVVLNATPGSALTCFPRVDLDDVLAGRMAA